MSWGPIGTVDEIAATLSLACDGGGDVLGAELIVDGEQVL